VAWDGDEVVGQVLSVIQNGRAEVFEVSVRPAWRRRGLAHRLLSRALQALRERGIDVIRLHTVAEFRTRARELYGSLGFRVLKEFPRYPKPFALDNGEKWRKLKSPVHGGPVLFQRSEGIAMAHVPDATRPDPGALCLFLPGSFRLAYGGRTVHFPMRNAESLLTFLALRLEAHSRTRLAALCWGDVGDEQACLSLRVALSTLRKDRVRLLPEFRPESEGGSTSGSGDANSA
jgi:predicted GNAT family acetyltransferase